MSPFDRLRVNGVLLLVKKGKDLVSGVHTVLANG